MIDTHTHLYSEEFDQDRSETIQRAIDQGISTFYLPAIDSEILLLIEAFFCENQNLLQEDKIL